MSAQARISKDQGWRTSPGATLEFNKDLRPRPSRSTGPLASQEAKEKEKGGRLDGHVCQTIIRDVSRRRTRPAGMWALENITIRALAGAVGVPSYLRVDGRYLMTSPLCTISRWKSSLDKEKGVELYIKYIKQGIFKTFITITKWI